VLRNDYDIVMLVLNSVTYDSRVQREAAALVAAGWRVLVIGTQRSYGGLPDREKVPAGYTIWRVRYGRFGAGLHRPWRWIRHGLQAVQIWRALLSVRTRAFHAHDLPALLIIAPISWLRRRARLVYDSHELYLFMPQYTSRWTQVWHRLTRPVFMWLEGRLARRADAVVTVCDPIARALAWWYGLPRPVVVRNCVDPVPEDAPVSIDIPARLEGRRWIVHTGEMSNRRRTMRELVDAMALLADDVALVCLGPNREAGELLAQAERLHIAKRVIVIPPVLPDPADVPGAIRDAEVAVALLRPNSWHTRATLPIKLFEAVAAGLPVVASNTFGVRRLVRRHELGIVCNSTDPAAIAAALRRLLEPDKQAFYRAHVREAQAVLNWQVEAAKLCALYEGLLA
jgi:glycosyltransferase involved in cell wall biosynthesis